MKTLDLELLENVVHLPNGETRARCPACAQEGTDSSGDHLLIFKDGRFGCCVNPGCTQHRKKIFALAKIAQVGSEAITGKQIIYPKGSAKRWLEM